MKRLFYFRHLLIALALFLIILNTSPVRAAADDDDEDDEEDTKRFRVHPHGYEYLDCSACVTFAEYLGRRMNASLRYDAGGSASVLTTHRLNENNKLKRRDYATSELRAAEVLDKLCSDALEENYVLRLNLKTRLRVYEPETSDLPFAQFYSLQDSRAIKETAKTAVRGICQRLMGEQEEEMTAAVRELKLLNELEWRLCGGNGNSSATPPPNYFGPVTKLCANIEPSMELERQRIIKYEKWQNVFSQRREDAIEDQGGKSKEPILLEPVTDAKPQEFTMDDFSL